MKKTHLLVAAILGLSTVAATAAYAQQIYVCTGCTAPPGGDPNFIDPTSINIGFAGNHTAVSPLLVLVGVPGSNSAPTMSLPLGVNPAAAGAYYGLNNATTGGLTGAFEGTMTSGNAYATAGLTTGSGGGSSESFVNWTTSPFPGGGLNPDAGVTSFGIYAYGINFALNSGPGGNSPITIDFGGTTAGDFVIAYNCAVAGTTCASGNIGETPFTNAGVTGGPPTPPNRQVPEPSTLLMLGSGLLGLAAFRKFRVKK